MNTDSIDIARILASTRHCRLSREQLHCLADVLECKKYKKGERILDENEVCTCLRYIEKGMTRQFYFKYNKDLTEHIAYEGGIVICLESYLKSEPSRLMIETLENSVIWEIPKTAVEKLSLADAEIGVWYRRGALCSRDSLCAAAGSRPSSTHRSAVLQPRRNRRRAPPHHPTGTHSSADSAGRADRATEQPPRDASTVRQSVPSHRNHAPDRH